MFRKVRDFIRDLRAQIRWQRLWSEMGHQVRIYRSSKEKKPVFRVVWESLRMTVKYRALPDQYFTCRLYRPGIPLADILEYIPRYAMYRWFKAINSFHSGDHRLLFHKAYFHMYLDRADFPSSEPILYLLNQTWYTPSIEMLTTDQALEIINTSNVESIFVKPSTFGQGRGISRFVRENGTGPFRRSDDTVLNKTFLEHLAHTGSYILEKGLIQHPEMAKLNSSSVNTFRIQTGFFSGMGAEVLHAVVRIGGAGNCVDNVSAGGCFVYIDAETGDPQRHGYDTDFNRITHHPQTGLDLTRLSFPFFDEVTDLAKRAACLFPTMPLIGWDIAYTEHGPVVIEGNFFGSHEGFEICTGGMAPMIKQKWGEAITGLPGA